MSINWNHLEQQQKEAESLGWKCVVGSVIFSPDGLAFVQKRSLNKKLFPGSWDIVGGHVEEGETLREALEREVFEETGWKVKDIQDVISQSDWSATKNSQTLDRREFNFLITVEGDLDKPVIESNNFTEWKWLAKTETSLLLQDQSQEDNFIFNIVEAAFRRYLSLMQ